jgi:hypothetical protein
MADAAVGRPEAVSAFALSDASPSARSLGGIRQWEPSIPALDCAELLDPLRDMPSGLNVNETVWVCESAPPTKTPTIGMKLSGRAWECT